MKRLFRTPERPAHVSVKIIIDSNHYYYIELMDTYTLADTEEYLETVFNNRDPVLILEGHSGHRLVLPRALYTKAAITIDGPEK